MWRFCFFLSAVLPISVACGSSQNGDPSNPVQALEPKPAPTDGAANPTPVAPGSGAGAAAPPLDCSAPRAAPARMRLLSESQYNNAVLDLLAVGGNPGAGFGAQVFAALDDTRVEERANAAAAIAAQAVANLPAWAPCTPAPTGAASDCGRRIVQEISAKAYRRPLSDSDLGELQALFDAGLAEKDFATGVEWFLTGLLQSPDFLYELVRPAADELPGDVRPLSTYEYANRIAFLVWDGPPDTELTAAAASGELEDASLLQAQLSRMIQDPKFSRSISQFYSRWLNLHAFGELARDDEGFNQQVVTSLATSLLLSATELYSSEHPNLSSLLSGDSYYMNDVLRQFYGVPGSGTEFTPTALPSQSRRGILTHPALMALLARPAESFPIGRGLFVLRTVLCKKVPPPPPGFVIPQLPAVQGGVSTRQRLDMHVANPVCNSCHGSIDPAGFAFEDFDEVGRFRTVDQGVPIDSSGTLTVQSDVDGSFATGDDFLTKLASSADVKSCFVEKYLDFALSREETDPSDACSIQRISESFVASGDLAELVVSIAMSDAFRLRLAEGIDQ